MSKSNSPPSPSVLPKWTSLSSLHESYASTRGKSYNAKELRPGGWGAVLARPLALGARYLVFAPGRHHTTHAYIFF